MAYYISTVLPLGYERAIESTEAALKEQGFGIVTRIDMQATLKAKLGAEFRPYMILGACSPSLAFEALQLEDKVGTMLPCNVIVQDTGSGKTEVAAIDPVQSMAAIDNPQLLEQAAQVRDKLSKVIESLALVPEGAA